jgi:phage tail-like protein
MAQINSMPTGPAGNVTSRSRGPSGMGSIPTGNATSSGQRPPHQTGSMPDPIPSFRFRIELDGIIEAGFTECKGLGMKWKVFQYKEGGVNEYVHQLPERVEYSKITLKRGIALSSALWDWCQQGILDGQVKRRNVSIILFDKVGDEVREVKRWNLRDAFPIKWSGPDLKADSKNVAIETLEFVHHGLMLDE